ncbi:undecaprenyldiphospho-muramoylpentapeptide beta-N-acetylglucosaminyltransferase [Pseudovibrio exalbescens]|uniref:UDP-N-acetylglucosamine--N-acetylmuramyl-(pentapeptide) pyrophosphoryl-undecaprenol N-acetylglucosamine transferase n=1 Tax=Pseudovibrio exalbescens TaxID=197461 RepID=A0A1U7JKW9_9HYPH|nr:undecaprenyldiphospho-muramoylpentapeptide beta-N-acetylglucosaminyltransferase [Pseudovibrio exalbescens]OKL45396.1 UDP-N-acetylglucosamine--N-acetylmuramyl-(pentapeptide) pyrophosphoryl-undecaprenol N-acetylglucosamine transferase [Pseudovibrio exalbescens]
MKPTIMLTAGGTGGHLFPAEALAGELSRRGYRVELMTDERADKYGSAFPADEVHLIQSDTLRGRNPFRLMKTVLKLGLGTLQARKILKQKQPLAMVGFGGYPTFPPMFAAALAGVPTILHEANAVMGRANRLLAARATKVAVSLPVRNLPSTLADKVVMTGNPLRDNVLAVSETPFHAPEVGEPFHLLVFGGSQGARFFSSILPEALALLTTEERARLAIVQQCRSEDLATVEQAYQKLGIAAQLETFFKDLPQRMASAHLVISRAGAGTLCELAAIGRPAILVPYPGAVEDDQGNNAKFLEDAGAAWPVRQKELSADRLADMLRDLMTTPAKLRDAATAAKREGRPDAVQRLADLVEQTTGRAAHVREYEEVTS